MLMSTKFKNDCIEWSVQEGLWQFEKKIRCYVFQPNSEGVLYYSPVFCWQLRHLVSIQQQKWWCLNACCPWNSTTLAGLGLQDWRSGFSLPLPPYLLLPQLTSGWLAFLQFLKQLIIESFTASGPLHLPSPLEKSSTFRLLLPNQSLLERGLPWRS